MRWGALFLFILVVVVLGFCVFIAWTQYHARKKDLPAPTWQSYVPFANARHGRSRRSGYDGDSGVGSWLRDKWARIQGRGRNQGSYAEPLEGPWDVRMEGNMHTSTPYSAHMDEEDDIGFESTSAYYGAHYDSGPPPYPDDHVSSPRPARPTRDSPEDIGQPQASHHSHQQEQPTNPFVSEEDDHYESQTTEPNKHGNTDAESTQYQQRLHHSGNSA